MVCTEELRPGNPVDVDLEILQSAGDEGAIFSQLDFFVFGRMGFIDGHGNDASVRPRGWRQLGQGGREIVGGELLFFMIDKVEQREAIGLDY